MKDRMQIKRWMQGLGLVYVLLLCSVVPWQREAGQQEMWQQEAERTKETAVETRQSGEISALQAADETETGGRETSEKPKIALTFDDGPNASWTPVLLDGLKERSVKATFFLIGTNVEKGDNAEIVRRMQEEGHLIGNHTYHHVEITRVSDETALKELSMTNEVIERITGEPVEYMRPPFGAWQKSLEEKLHVFPVLWTVDPLDWTTENVDEIVNKVVTETEENDIILLHDCYQSSVEAALRIIDLLQAEGYEFVTVDELIVD